MARKSVAGRMLSTTQLEGYCGDQGGLYFPPGAGGAYACLLPDGTLIVCGGDFPYYCVESRTLDDKGLGLSEAQTEDLTIQSADYERSRIRANADLDLAEVDVEALVADEGADVGAIEDALKRSEAARTASRLESIKARRAALAVLTPEQREEWQKRIDEQISRKSIGGFRSNRSDVSERHDEELADAFDG
jgi:DNA-binding MarR family transcriptional regulator